MERVLPRRAATDPAFAVRGGNMAFFNSLIEMQKSCTGLMLVSA